MATTMTLVQQWAEQVGPRARAARSGRLYKEPEHLVAMAMCPGGHSLSNLGNPFPRLGQVMCLVQTSAVIRQGRHSRRLSLPCRGYGLQLEPVGQGDLRVVIGGAPRVSYDFGYAPFAGARARIPDPDKNPDLVSMLLRMDEVRVTSAAKAVVVAPVAQLPLPTAMLGFRDVPAVSCSPGFRAIVRERLQREADDPMADVPTAVYEDVLLTACLPPDDPINNTGLWLLPHQVASQEHLPVAVAAFADCRAAGDLVCNPAAAVFPAGMQKWPIPNPAFEAARLTGIRLNDTTEESLPGLLANFRGLLTPRLNSLFSDDACLDAMGTPLAPIYVPPLPVADLPAPLVARAMRQALGTPAAACCRDEDLVKAAQQPKAPLFAAGRPTVQVGSITAEKDLVFERPFYRTTLV